jgi:hypothetical protein
MSGVVLTLSIAALLLSFTAIGWVLHWLWHRAHRGSTAEAAERRALVARLHAAELARDAAERDLAALRAAERDTLDAERADLTQKLAAAEADRAATMEALSAARRNAAEWRQAYEAVVREDRDDP